MKFFFPYSSEALGALRKTKSRNLLVMNFEWGWWVSRPEEGCQTLMSQPEESTPIQVEFLFYTWPKGFWAWVCLLRNLQWCFLHEEIFTQSHFSQGCACLHNKQLSCFSRRELITFSVHAFHIQHWVSLSDQKKGPCCRVVLSDSEAHRHK